MYFHKSLALALLASSVSVGALTAPKSNLNNVVVSTPTPKGPMLWNKKAEEEVASNTAYGGVDNFKNDLIAPGIYTVFTGLLIAIIYSLRDAVVTKTIGSTALAVVTGALIWDNVVIAIGSLFFRDINSNPTKYKILETISFPRFTLHAVGVPFQCITIAEMGKFAGVGFLQSDRIQMAVIAAAAVVAVLDRKKFVESPGIILDDQFEDTPFDALERDLVKFTYKEPKFSYVIPVIILALFNLAVGIIARDIPGSTELGNWMVFAAGSALVGNALPGPVMAFAGNLGEVGMQYGLLNAARIVYGEM